MSLDPAREAERYGIVTEWETIMGNVSKTLLLASAALAVAGCKGQQQEDQNIVITNEMPANAEIEALPPDESSGTTTNELENGADNPDVNELNASSNSY